MKSSHSITSAPSLLPESLLSDSGRWGLFLLVMGLQIFGLCFLLSEDRLLLQLCALVLVAMMAWFGGRVVGLLGGLCFLLCDLGWFGWQGPARLLWWGMWCLAGLGFGQLHLIRHQLQRRWEELTRDQRKLSQMATAVEFAGDSIEITDMKGRYVYVNPAFEELTGYLAEEVMGQTPAALLRSGKHDDSVYEEMWETVNRGEIWRGELTGRSKDGAVRNVSVTLSPIRNKEGKICNLLAIKRDITQQKEHEERLRHRTLHDMLTGLPNRRLLQDRIQQRLQQLGRHPEPAFALLFLDLDRFKNINDSFGHLEGDQLLLQCAKRLARVIRSEDTVARLGGDEFVLLLTHIQEEQQALEIATRIKEEMSAPFVLQGQEYVLTASIGLTMGHESYRSAEEMLRDADNAMYRAKESGRNRCVMFRPKMLTTVSKRLQIERDLRVALDEASDEIQVYYQPIYTIPGKDIVGFEALVRWQHPTRGLLSPGEFIEIAEETDLIIPLGLRVLDQACQHIKACCEHWEEDFRPILSVNLSAKQLSQMAHIDEILEVIQASGFPPQQLKLEVTESTLVHDFETGAALLHKLQSAGVLIAMDDFGTGYSSLSYLYRFPFDCLKIDRSFILPILKDPRAAQLVRATVQLAQQLGMHVVAEGIEEVAQEEMLEGFDCHQAQGYLFSRPLPAAQVLPFVQSSLLPA